MIFYERKGNGPTIVFIHGFLGSTAIYEKVRPLFEQSFDCVWIDFAGHGKSSDVAVEPTVYAYAQQIIDVLHKEQIEESIWVGHSMGGYLILAALEKQLTKIPKAVLAYSGINADNAEAKAKREASIEKIDLQGKEAFVDGLIENFFKDDADPTLVANGAQIAKQASVQGLKTALLTMKSRPDQTAFFEQITTPLLILEGSDDKVLPPINAHNAHAEKVITPTGHLGMLEEPQQFFEAIVKFIDA